MNEEQNELNAPSGSVPFVSMKNGSTIRLMPTSHNEKIRWIKRIRGVGWFYDMTKAERDQILNNHTINKAQ
tara:strand:+ start:492 stop:704 length:213 start_codon:yes stop_codon:yes gene_type:complete